MQWKVNRYGFDAKKWHSKENTLLHVEGDLIDNWIPLLHLMIFFFQSAVDYGRDCPKDLWLWHGLWYPDAHDKQQGECSMDGSWGLWRCACEKHYIFPFFLRGGTWCKFCKIGSKPVLYFVSTQIFCDLKMI